MPIHDQVAAGLDVITDGEQTRLDFNLSFYGFSKASSSKRRAPRRFGPPAHDQRGKHASRANCARRAGSARSRVQAAATARAAPAPTLKASVPGPYTLSGRLVPNAQYPDRYALTEALLPIVRAELEALVAAGCTEITVDEPSMSCYAHREDPEALRRHFQPHRRADRRASAGSPRISASAITKAAPSACAAMRRCFPAFLDFNVDEIHVEMASREFAEIEFIAQIAAKKDVAVGIIDVKSYYIETPEDVAARVRLCLEACAGRAALLRAGLRPEPDRPLGRETEAAQHGRGREEGAAGSGCALTDATRADTLSHDFKWSIKACGHTGLSRRR